VVAAEGVRCNDKSGRRALGRERESVCVGMRGWARASAGGLVPLCDTSIVTIAVTMFKQ
jgi:hypothetical protein